MKQADEREIANLIADLAAKIKGYTHTQSAAAASWVIPHNLGRKPSVVLICNSNPGDQVYADIHHDSVNQLTVTWPSPESGEAYLS